MDAECANENDEAMQKMATGQFYGASCIKLDISFRTRKCPIGEHKFRGLLLTRLGIMRVPCSMAPENVLNAINCFRLGIFGPDPHRLGRGEFAEKEVIAHVNMIKLRRL